MAQDVCLVLLTETIYNIYIELKSRIAAGTERQGKAVAAVGACFDRFEKTCGNTKEKLGEIPQWQKKL